MIELIAQVSLIVVGGYAAFFTGAASLVRDAFGLRRTEIGGYSHFGIYAGLPMLIAGIAWMVA